MLRAEEELSPLAEIIADHYDSKEWQPLATDYESWVEVKASGEDATTTLVGLFGGDLTAFLEDCAAAGDDCDVADYAGLSGWAIGIEMTPDQARLRQATEGDTNIVIFADQFIGLKVYWYSDTNANA